MLKYLFAAFAFLGLASVATAADLPRRGAAPAPAPYIEAGVPVFTGFYAGVNGGYNWGVLKSDTGEGKFDAGFGGVQAGYNHQFGNIVVGVEGDIQAVRKGRSEVAFAGARTDLNWFGTVRGRVGYAFDRVMVYGTAGYAGVGVDNTVIDAFGFENTRGTVAHGFAYGAGVEYAFADRWSVRAEYLRLDTAKKNYDLVGTDGRYKADVVRGGVNYRF